jgi:hypothetical protein
MKLKVSLSSDDVIAACKNYIEEKLMLEGPGWQIECQNDYAISRSLEFEVEAPTAKEPGDAETA